MLDDVDEYQSDVDLENESKRERAVAGREYTDDIDISAGSALDIRLCNLSNDKFRLDRIESAAARLNDNSFSRIPVVFSVRV